MASIYDLKPAFQSLLRPLAGALAGAGITPNQVTLAALALSAATGAALALSPGSRLVLGLVPPALLVRMALNALDGMMARKHGMESAAGALLNELGDVLADAALYLPLALVPNAPRAAIVLLVLLGVIAEMTGVVAVQIGARRRYDGPLGKSDRAFLFGLVCLLWALGFAPGRWSAALLWLAVPFAGWTIFNRARRALAEAGA